MARFFLPPSALATACAIGVLAAPAGAAPAPADSAATVGLGASLESCSTTGEVGRSAVFSATMPALARSSRIQMRFDLFTRPDVGGLWKRVSGVPTFGTWDSAAPGAGGLKVTKQVNGLRLGSAYRATVRFRWLAASGKVVRRVVRSSRACVQPDPRPDLGVAARGASGDLLVVVRNLGRQAGPFELRVASGGRQLLSQRISGLKAGRVRALVFRELECEPGSTVKVTVDPGDSIAERSEANNSAELRCPASS
jgi:hypothetical protein